MATKKYEIGSDGYYRTKAWDGTYNEDGSKHRINLKSSKSSADLEKQVNALKNKIFEGTQVQKTDVYFLNYAKEWLKTYKAVRENNTQAMYNNIITKHFTALEGIKLQDIRRSHLQLVINSAIKKPRTCQQIALTFKQIINTAVDDKYLPAIAVKDICQSVELPKYHAAEKRTLTEKEKQSLSTADFTPMEKTFVLILYACGLRRGEVLALKQFDIDLKRSVLTVRQSVEFVANNPSLKVPKTTNSLRSVPMPPYLTEHLTQYLGSIKGDYLMYSKGGGLMTKSSYRCMWDSILNKINKAIGGTDALKVTNGLTAHIFRHNYCSNLCYQIPAISTKKIARLLGDSETMVIKVYSHILEDKEDVENVINIAMSL